MWAIKRQYFRAYKKHMRLVLSSYTILRPTHLSLYYHVHEMACCTMKMSHFTCSWKATTHNLKLQFKFYYQNSYFSLLNSENIITTFRNLLNISLFSFHTNFDNVTNATKQNNVYCKAKIVK